jgi:hypothetical protein
VRAFQWLGYDGTTLAIYDKALTDGDLLLRVPGRPAKRRGIAALLQRHHVHDVGYFGPVGCQKSAWPVSCSDALGSAVGHDDQPYPSVCSI